MRVYAGIDPGLTGAIALLRVADDGTQTVAVTPTPVYWTRQGRGKRRRYDVQALRAIIRAWPPIALAYVELQGARPLQGAASTFTTGYGEGLWHGLLSASDIPFAVIDPRDWRGRVGLRKVPDKAARKAEVRLAACRRFPTIPIRVDQSDAIMIAAAALIEDGVVARRRDGGA